MNLVQSSTARPYKGYDSCLLDMRKVQPSIQVELLRHSLIDPMLNRTGDGYDLSIDDCRVAAQTGHMLHKTPKQFWHASKNKKK